MLVFITAGLVIGVVVFALIVNHRRPDESAFIKQFEHATRNAQQAPQPVQEVVERPLLKLGKRDFRTAYIGKARLDRCRGDLEIEGNLGEVSINGELSADGNLRVGAGTILNVSGDVNVGGAIYVASILNCDKTIESGHSIHCGDTIESKGSVFASGTIGCGRCLKAAGSIMAREDIRAGVEVSAGDAIHAGGTIESPIVTAGREGDPRTITCSRLLRGKVSRGELVETGDGRG
ncbi:hypothetical protein KDL29_15570 [bacterium]|nr:hypothetical protein [bacterium]MCB1220328.1 hypothetical protein [bacterium]UNM07868.1 MAG: hypothetical protein H7A35_13555 [Planctomycetales bacterium]